MSNAIVGALKPALSGPRSLTEFLFDAHSRSGGIILVSCALIKSWTNSPRSVADADDEPPWC